MTTEAQQLIDWFEEEAGFQQGTKAPYEWVLRAEQELRRQQEKIQQLRQLLDTRPAINAALPGSYIEWSGLVYAQSMGQLSPPGKPH